MDRSKTAPLVLLAGSLVTVAWSILLVFSPGGSEPLEWLQFLAGLIIGSYALFAFVKDDPVHERRCRQVLLGLAIAGVIVVLGLAADQRSSRTWARLGWFTLVLGFAGSVIAWWSQPQHRAATVGLTVLGAFLILSGLGLTLNCDPTIQRTWCNPNYEREQVLAESIDVEGEFLSSGRAGGSTGAAQVTYLVDDGATLDSSVSLPGEWAFEERDLQPNEVERGRYTSDESPNSDCHIDANLSNQPPGQVLTLLVGCGGVS